MKRLIYCCCLVAALGATTVQSAEAFLWAWTGGACEPLKSTEASCEKVPNDGAGSVDQSFITMDCNDTTTEGYVVHFRRPDGVAALASVDVSVRAKPAAAGDVCSEVTIGCVDATMTTYWGTPVRESNTFGIAVYGGLTHTVSFPNNTYSYCVVRVRRVHGDGGCSDTAVGDLKFLDGVAQ